MSQNHGANAKDDMISILTHQLTSLGKDGSVVMLAGTNKGAVMKADLLDDAMEYYSGEEANLNAYNNSNYQAVNNSVLIDGRCEVEDPGVHIEIVDCMDGHQEDDDEHEKEWKKKEKKGSESA